MTRAAFELGRERGMMRGSLAQALNSYYGRQLAALTPDPLIERAKLGK